MMPHLWVVALIGLTIFFQGAPKKKAECRWHAALPRYLPGFHRQSLKTEQLSDNPKSAFDLGVGAPLSPRKKRRWHRLLRKEVIQPHLPIRLPCYDFTPLTGHTFCRSFLAVRPRTSGAADSGGVTGGVYKARERIHRSTADLRLLAIPPSCSRVADCNPHYGCLFGIRSASRPRFPLSHPL